MYPFFEIGLTEALAILWLPLVLEFPRIAVKCVFLLRGKLGEKKLNPTSEKITPKVSIVVPAHDEGAVISTTIESLVSLPYPNKEIVVVDDNSTDDTYLKAKPYAARGELILVRKTEPYSNKARALRYGAKFTSGDIIVCMDADTVIQHESMIRIVKRLEDSETVGVAGNVRVYNTDSLLEKLQAYEYLLAMEMGRRFQSLIQVLLIIPGAFGAFRRKVIEAVGGIDEDTMTEDFDLVLKLRKTGSRVSFAGDAIAWTIVPTTISGWARQRTRWAYGQLQCIAKHSDLLLNLNFGLRSVLSMVDMLLMDVFLLFLRFIWLLSLPLLFSSIPSWRVVVLIVAVYLIVELVQAACALAVSQRGKEEMQYLLLIPIVVLFYRPLYSFVRILAYLRAALGLEVSW